ncbi:bifunctional 5,10-methylenetetrahydrofolate dehydrogenase/5,10-methenyltetrahydrofolate cyclohydrolase [Romboutsia ilealis]|uniref:bifunctional 5,10-methylenetetrahydrofolate dehydrogenase/5,10-methenyltetrahydrofolate cyclohydrolase n=1 Tax=Romboutsia ilealis TaxID=1115758 RepID=UPI00272BEE51|nr:bifunctional 5,10-methylenetetrahydrofolate dehydrogenase/5,10-methenyltetrahydrofolate cyclohydrolase [Romboutsia ilealis]
MEAIKLIAKPILEKRYEEIKQEVAEIGQVASLTIIVGERPDSEMYVNMKHKKCQEVGIDSRIEKLPTTITTDELLAILRSAVASNMYDGILIQLPLPKHIDQELVLEKFGDYLINENTRPLIDVDALSYVGKRYSTPCTPKGIMTLMKYYDIDLIGRHVVVVGRSEIVGKPVAALCQAEDATVSVIHRRTTEKVKMDLLNSADVIIACAGSGRCIGSQHVAYNPNKPYIIDAGVTFIDGKSIGDVDEDCRHYVSGYTPYTGAVGPMTILSLIENIIESAKKR